MDGAISDDKREASAFTRLHAWQEEEHRQE